MKIQAGLNNALLSSAVAAVILLTCRATHSAAASHPAQAKPPGRGEPFAVRLAAEGDELSVLFPFKPSVYRFDAGYSFKTDGELIKEERVAAAYSNGVVYILRLYRAGDPRRALRDYREGGPSSRPRARWPS